MRLLEVKQELFQYWRSNGLVVAVLDESEEPPDAKPSGLHALRGMPF
jgi:hypothetical protein